MSNLGFGIIKSSKLEQNAGEGPDVYVCKTDLSGTEKNPSKDIQSVEHEHHTGSQSRPPKESRGFFAWFNPAWKFFIGVNDGVPKQALEEGERISYSSDGGTIKAFIKYLKTGILHINGDTDFAVRYQALEIAFNELKTAYNTHTHGGAGATPQSAADITTAKIDTIKMPGVP